MSDHFDSAEPQTDITDLYAFQKPGDSNKSILILNVNPAAPTLAGTFDPEASYELKIDIDGDSQPEIAFHILFRAADNDQQTEQTAIVYRATGAAAREAGAVGEVILKDAPVSFGDDVHVTTAGEYRFYAGLRSDPFFVDPEGFTNNFQWTGHDANAEANVFGIVLEVLNSGLGPNPQIGIWARTVAPVDGALTQVDQVGQPGTTFFVDGEDKIQFHQTPPGQQRSVFLKQYVGVFQGFGYTEDEATAIAMRLIPDVLAYDYTSPAGYPNGRKLADDIIDSLVSLMTRGEMTADLCEPHTDYLRAFPYLGPPHPVVAADQASATS